MHFSFPLVHTVTVKRQLNYWHIVNVKRDVCLRVHRIVIEECGMSFRASHDVRAI